MILSIVFTAEATPRYALCEQVNHSLKGNAAETLATRKKVSAEETKEVGFTKDQGDGA